MSVKGDFARLAKLANAFSSLKAKNGVMTKACAAASVKLNRADFSSQRSPDGAGWVDGPAYNGLHKKGKLAASFQPRSTDHSFGVRNVARYAWFHQTGAVLRNKIQGSKGKLGRARKVSFRRKVKAGMRSGPQQQLKFQGPRRKGTTRGILPARPIVPEGGIPAGWEPKLDAVVMNHYRGLLKV